MIILIIIIINALIGFFQELGAQKSLDALKKMTVVTAKVLRDSNIITIDSKYLIPGDIVILEAGDKVPADCRLIECSRLKVEESALTGESVPVDKNVDLIKSKVTLGDQKNMIFSSTTIVDGTCKAIVVSTGMNTEIGKITQLIKEAKDEQTPLQRRLDSFGKKVGVAVLGVCIFIFGLSFGKAYFGHGFDSKELIEFMFIAISLAVAAVPTSLPAVVTISLSIGVKKLLKRNALVRKLSSVETLGSCDVICTDKTGTLTKNEMTVRFGWTLDSEIEFDGLGYSPQGSAKNFTSKNKSNLLLIRNGLLCNNASLFQKNDGWKISGDSTEAALIVSARKTKIKSYSFKRLDEIPFDSSRKLMSVLVTDDLLGKNKKLVYTKGAPDGILSICNSALVNNKVVPLTKSLKNKILKQNDQYSSKALRVIGFCYKSVTKKSEFAESKMTFIGLQAMIDPPRKDVIDSIKLTKQAGIRVIMITGDYKETARAIGEEIGITGKVLTGVDLEKMSEAQLDKALESGTNIFARVMPEHKQRIVASLQKHGHIVAMTGDGVNDAPALKKANIGVAVGSGTEVAKEASDFVLLDDSFSNIVGAIEEGRGIYDNIQKSIMLLLSGNLGEVLILFMAILLGFNLPLTAILLLWINLVTDGAPALAYSVDKYGKDIMTKKPRPLNESILPFSKAILIFVLGSIGTIIALVLFYFNGGISTEIESIRIAQTLVFNFVVLYELILTILIRLDYNVPIFTNKFIWFAIVGSVVLQAVLMYTPMSGIFKIVALNTNQLLSVGIAGLIFFGISACYSVISRKINARIS